MDVLQQLRDQAERPGVRFLPHVVVALVDELEAAREIFWSTQREIFWSMIAVAGAFEYMKAEREMVVDPTYQLLAKHLPPAWKADLRNATLDEAAEVADRLGREDIAVSIRGRKR